LINNIPEIKRKFAEYKFFADPKILNDYNITNGDEVAVLGYPLGMRHRLTNHPLIRKGLISTEIGESLEILTEENGKIRNRIIRGFIIDGGTSPGSSGSPVVLYPNAIHYNLDGSVGMGPPTTPYLLGIVSEARITNIKDKSGKPHLNLSGLSVVFDAETIKETIELFFN